MGLVDGLLGSIIPGYAYFSTIFNLFIILIILLMARKKIRETWMLAIIGILAFLIVFGYIEIPM